MADTLGMSLAVTVREARMARGLSPAALAHASGVSRAMISKIELGNAQPTAALLARLSGALGLTLTELIAHAEGSTVRLIQREAQPVWTDPLTGYTRRAISPPASTHLQLVEVELPAGGRVALPAESFLFIDQQIWVLRGHLEFREGDEVHELFEGDCLQLGAPAACEFVNPTNQPCQYVVALRKR